LETLALSNGKKRTRYEAAAMPASDGDAFVHTLLLVTDKNSADSIVDEIRRVATERLPSLEGFQNLAILCSEDARVVVLSAWKSRDNWARAEWDQFVQQSVARVVSAAATMDSQTYRRVFFYEPATSRSLR